MHHHAAGGQRRVGIGLEHLRERRPAVGGVTQAVAGDDVGVQPAPLQIGLRFGADFELLGVKIGGGAHGVFQRLLLFFALGTLGGVFARRVAVMRHYHTDAVGKLLHRFGKRQPLMLHHKADGRAVGAAAEAVVKLLGRADGKRGRLFFVERAAGHVVGAAFFQRHVLVDHINDIGFGQQFVNKFGGYHARDSTRLRDSLREKLWIKCLGAVCNWYCGGFYAIKRHLLR